MPIQKKINKRRSLVALLVSGLAMSQASAITYEYDTLGRLTRVTYDDGSYVQYAYDAAGNRVTVSATKN